LIWLSIALPGTVQLASCISFMRFLRLIISVLLLMKLLSLTDGLGDFTLVLGEWYSTNLRSVSGILILYLIERVGAVPGFWKAFSLDFGTANSLLMCRVSFSKLSSIL